MLQSCLLLELQSASAVGPGGKESVSWPVSSSRFPALSMVPRLVIEGFQKEAHPCTQPRYPRRRASVRARRAIRSRVPSDQGRVRTSPNYSIVNDSKVSQLYAFPTLTTIRAATRQLYQ